MTGVQTCALPICFPVTIVKEVSRDGRMSIIWIGETYSQLAWFKSSELEVVDNLVSILTCGLANFRGDGKESADKFYPMNLCYIKKGVIYEMGDNKRS